MKLLDFNKVLRDLQYKPNVGYRAYERDGMWWIRVIMLVENARAPWRQWDVKPYRQNDEEMYYDLVRRIPSRFNNIAGYSPSREVIEVVGQYPIPMFAPGEEIAFVGWMRFTLHEMENHETDEWIRYKGELLNDPHKEGL